MTEKQQAECTTESDGTGVFVVFEGVRIAKRGESGTPQAGTWAIYTQVLRLAANHWALETMQPRRGGKIMTSKRRKSPNRWCCSLFQIEGYERLLATTSRLCRNLACFWSLRLSRIGRKVLASIDG